MKYIVIFFVALILGTLWHVVDIKKKEGTVSLANLFKDIYKERAKNNPRFIKKKKRY